MKYNGLYSSYVCYKFDFNILEQRDPRYDLMLNDVFAIVKVNPEDKQKWEVQATSYLVHIMILQ